MARESAKRGRAEPRSGKDQIGGNQGEGNREADRRYREAAKRFAESGRAERAARDAAETLDGDAVVDADRPADQGDDESDEPR